MADARRMSKDDLKGRLDDPNTIIIDVRRERGETKIRNAHLENPDSVDSWMDKYPKDKTIVTYCA